MTVFITVIHVIVCFMLIGVILLQAGRGQGLTGASFGGGNVQSLFGTKAADFLTKATTAAAICFVLTCLTLDMIESRKSRSLLETERAQSQIDLEQIKEALEKVKSEAKTGEGLQEDLAAGLTVEEGAISSEVVEEAVGNARAAAAEAVNAVSEEAATS